MAKLRIATISVALVSIFGLASCGGDSSSTDKKIDDQEVAGDAQDQQTIIIDVRTVEEFAEGHLMGALNYNVEDGTLESVLGDLDPNATYQVYCRTGRRSALATDLMTSNGFSNVADLGSLEEAAAVTGIEIVS